MPCYHPITAYRSRPGRQSNGKWPIVFNKSAGYVDKELTIPCGKCIGCRLEKSRQWAIRCMHEKQMHDESCFITLTYDNDHVNDNYSLVKSDFVNFMKKLRRKYEPKKIRFIHSGEYGEMLRRPHHHACLFGIDFPDRLIRPGTRISTSEALGKLWPYGFTSVGDVTWESAAYVARYVTKKITGEGANLHYLGREPEYITMSRRPGLGKEWYDKFKHDLYIRDECVVHHKFKCKPAKYYDKLYDVDNHHDMERIKYRREKEAPDRDWRDLRTSEFVAQYKLNLNKIRRSYENA